MEDHALLPGQRFCPMEDELLLYYLKPKVEGKEVPGKESLVCELDLYGDQEPWMIWERFEARRANDLRKYKDLYFFTQKKKASAKGSRACRKVGSGTWKGQNGAKNVYLLDENQMPTSTLLGFKKTYTYRNEGSVHHGRWIMYEFELFAKKQVNKNDYVLCLLRKNDELPEKKRKREQKEKILEDCVDDEDGESNLNSDPASVVEEPQEKRRRRDLPCSTKPQDDIVAAPSFEWADIEQWYNQASPSEAEQEAGPAPLEDEPHVALQGNEDLGMQQLPTEENLGQNFPNMPTFGANGIVMSGLDSHNDGNMEQQMGDEFDLMTERDVNDVYGGNLSELLASEGWSESFLEDLLNDDQLNSVEVGDGSDGLLDFSSMAF
ncbi:NAC domain-containing protein 72-like [Argentina anserina]|uniref:NAC domain-containing protein 72-like n=1 Tax=Argentina anserina TaxID=57926 RepID=UPI002176579C|nr:NAC domain-containing protein 72-like [Potentilla anserina]